MCNRAHIHEVCTKTILIVPFSTKIFFMEYEHNILDPDGKIITRNLSRLPRKIFRVFTRGVGAYLYWKLWINAMNEKSLNFILKQIH